MTRPSFSANLGFLWTEFELLDSIRAARRAGFDAVEVHWPYITHALDVALVLEELGMPLICLNTVGGDLTSGEFGLAALPGREDDARAAIDKAFAYAVDVSARHVHVLAGRTDDRRASETFVSNLLYAAARGHEFGVGVLIEPLSPEAQPGYFLNRVDQAVEILDRVDEPNVRLLFDCYHVGMIHGAVENLLDERVGHIQIASVPDRAEPDHGDIDYPALFVELKDMGYQGHVGAEYRPATTTEEGIGWLSAVARD
jgi:2-dehydrotetronate isomerase